MSADRTLVADYLRFLRRHPLWWLLPPVLVLLALFATILLTTSDDLAGLVYGLF